MTWRLGLLAAISSAGLSVFCGFARADSVPAQDTTNVLGILNPRNGSFQPLPIPSAADAAPAAIMTVGGQVNVTIVAFNKSALPTTSALWCTVSATVNDPAAFSYATRVYFAKAVVSATTVVCSVKIPYQATVTNPAIAVLSLAPAISNSLSLETLMPMPVTVPAGLSISIPRVSFPLPANGAVTSKGFFTVI
ncbi:MAG TPA: hypothetical protein VIG36_11960 [Methylocystis sp.]|jgi:hypothetical protein